MKSRAYKDVTLQQLRSFCATARHGSLNAAAAALNLAHPTVWKQVHALEQTFGTRLIEPHARGCRVTEAGEVLRSLAEPNVKNLDATELLARFAEALGRTNIHITVAGSPRLLAWDLPECIAEFVTQWPRVRFTLHESNGDHVARVVEAGMATIGFTPHLENRRHFSNLVFERWYELEIVLITPRDHPLARKRQIRPEDLRPYALIDAWNALRDTPAHPILVRLGLYDTQPRWVEARHAEVIRRCVEVGLGIALVTGVASETVHPHLHERVLSRVFGRSTVYLVRRKGTYEHPAVGAFAQAVRTRHVSHPMQRNGKARGSR